MELSVKSRYSFMDKMFLVFIFLMPLIPRPTVENLVRFIAPALIVIILYVYFIWFAFNRISLRMGNIVNFKLFVMICIMVVLYALKIVLNQDWSEFSYFISRVLSLSFLVVMVTWMSTGRVEVRSVYKAVFYGFIVLSMFEIYIGITGIPLFGEVRPPRTYGIQIPFFKTVAIPRSYGEFGIFASAAWAYFLLFREDYRKPARYMLGIILLMSIVISQSRSIYISIALVTFTFIIINLHLTRKFALFFLILAFLLPLVVSVVTTSFHDLPMLKIFLSEGVYEKNIYVRSAANRMAIDLITQDPLNLLLGISHSQWTLSILDSEGYETGLHNHFLSNLLFLGIIGGILYLLVFLIPIKKLLIHLDFKKEDDLLLLLVITGMVSCLQFYEGFFSLIVTLQLGTLWYRMGSR